MNDIQWNKIVLAEFRSLVFLTEDEEIVLQDWSGEKGTKKSEANTEITKYMSISKITRIRNRIREKYDAVQPYTPLLPKRQPEK